MQNYYCLHFETPAPIEEIVNAFKTKDFTVDVLQVFQHCYFLCSELSLSKIKFALTDFYSNDCDPRRFVVVKSKDIPEVINVCPAN